MISDEAREVLRRKQLRSMENKDFLSECTDEEIKELAWILHYASNSIDKEIKKRGFKSN